jgi:hypothetical protein
MKPMNLKKYLRIRSSFSMWGADRNGYKKACYVYRAGSSFIRSLLFNNPATIKTKLDMKRLISFIAFVALFFIVLMCQSCSQHSYCPTYGKVKPPQHKRF